MSRLKRLAVSSVLVTLVWACAASAQAPQRPPTRGIAHLAGDLYRVQNDDHYTVFLVTPALDFTVAAPGHGPIGTKADIVAHRRYFEQLGERVTAGIAAGRTLQQLQSARIMDEYKDWIEYDEDNDTNIANVYATIRERRR